MLSLRLLATASDEGEGGHLLPMVAATALIGTYYCAAGDERDDASLTRLAAAAGAMGG